VRRAPAQRDQQAFEPPGLIARGVIVGKALSAVTTVNEVP
jgi:hypothetical protein